MTTVVTDPVTLGAGVPDATTIETDLKFLIIQTISSTLTFQEAPLALVSASILASALIAANNLSDLVDAVAARGNLGAKNLYYVSGTSAPSNSVGIVNDFAINDNGVLYEKTGSTTWTNRIDLATGAEVTAAIAAHTGASDPHPVYLTQTEGDGRYPLSSALPESIDDRVAALLQAGANITLTYNDAGNILTIASTASGGATGLKYTYNTTAGTGVISAADLTIATGLTINATDAQGESASDVLARLKNGAIILVAKDESNWVRYAVTADYASGSVTVTVAQFLGAITSGNTVYLSIISDAPSAGGGGGGGLTPQTITASQTAADGIAYICNSSSLIEVTLPTTGSRFAVSNQGTGGFKIRNQSGVTAQIGTTLVDSITKYIANTNQYSYVELFKLGARWLATVQANVQYGFDVVNNAKSLLHFNETAGATSTADAVDAGRGITLSGGAVTATGGKFGNGLRLTANGDAATWTVPDALGTSDFCFEWFMATTNTFATWRYLTVYRGDVSTSSTAASTSNGDGFILNVENNVGGNGSADTENPLLSIFSFIANNSSSSWFTGSISTFIHCALVRNGTVFNFYSNGVLRNTVDLSVLSGAFSSTYGNSLGTNPINIRLGGLPTNGTRTPNAIFDEFRLTIGDPVYTATFTPPTAEFTYP
jgi:hypothetical protein